MRNCPLCQDRRCEVLWNRYVECPRCGCVFVADIRPASYEGEYYFFHPLSEKENQQRSERQLLYTTKLLSATKCGKLRLLDFGCGRGFFVNSAERAGFESYGVDVSKSAISEARQVRREEKFFLIGNHEDLEKHFSKNSFDVITVWEVIEHLKEPLALLQSLKDYLKPGGLVVLSTPNVGSLWATILKERWHGFDIPEYHLVYFNDRLLKDALERAGYRSVAVSTVPPITANQFFLSKNLAVGLTQRMFKSNNTALKGLSFCLTFIPCKLFEFLAPRLNLADSLLAFGQK